MVSNGNMVYNSVQVIFLNKKNGMYVPYRYMFK
jgi:hypothetical protein